MVIGGFEYIHAAVGHDGGNSVLIYHILLAFTIEYDHIAVKAFNDTLELIAVHEYELDHYLILASLVQKHVLKIDVLIHLLILLIFTTGFISYFVQT